MNAPLQNDDNNRVASSASHRRVASSVLLEGVRSLARREISRRSYRDDRTTKRAKTNLFDLSSEAVRSAEGETGRANGTPREDIDATVGAQVQDFYGHDFLVTPDVLTPRPETEQIIDVVLSLIGKPILPGVKPPQPQIGEDCTIWDVGTGSGCIAITLRLKLPQAKIIASDISEKALQIAQKNAQNLGATPITFIIAHLLEKVNTGEHNSLQTEGHKGKILDFAAEEVEQCGIISDYHIAELPRCNELCSPDIVVANLPYVDKSWPWVDQAALRAQDPDLALYAADGGLALIKELIKQAHSRFLILEADPCQHARIIDYAKDHGYMLKSIQGFILVFGA